jgi:predicted ATP-grasp superfamily ATP-dependent carboligase
MADSLLPAVVLGIDTPIGLAIIRDLGRRGVPVYGIARSSAALGLRSRFLRRGLLRASGGAAGLQQQLSQLAEEIGCACLFAIAESDITTLNTMRDVLPSYRLMFPDNQRMERVLRKDQTYAAAAQVGLDVPRTVHPASFGEVLAAAATLRYPVVLKWADPNAAVVALSRAALPLEKLEYCVDATALLACLRRYQAIGSYPMVQEFCPGYGLGQFVLMRGGEAHYRFQHRRLHEWPPEGGVSTLCTSLPPTAHAALMEQSVALLRALDWEGVAMVEYRYDPETGRAALMEINGRFWGSLPLACQAGAAFPWLVYQLFGLDRPVAQTPYIAGMRARFMAPESKRLWRVLTRPPVHAHVVQGTARAELCGYLADFLRPNTRYFVHSWGDPMPLLSDVAGVLARQLRQLGLVRKLHRSKT